MRDIKGGKNNTYTDNSTNIDNSYNKLKQGNLNIINCIISFIKRCFNYFF